MEARQQLSRPWLTDGKLEGVVFNCSCNIRWIQLWQQRGEAGLHNQHLFCNNGVFKIPLQRMNISHCDLPEISVSHSNLTVMEGDRVTITCNGSGVPVPEVDWTVGGLHSINTHQSNQYPPNVHSINLTLVNISRDDNSFMLTCIAENIVGMTNASIQLSVQFPPVIIKFEEPEKRHDTCMVFTVRANPLPTLRWYYNGREIKPTDYVTPKMDVYLDNLEGCLLFKNPTHHNNGNYTLEASNFLGVAVKTVYAHFLQPPFDVDYTEYGSPTPTAVTTMTHRPEEDTFGQYPDDLYWPQSPALVHFGDPWPTVSIMRVGLAGFALRYSVLAQYYVCANATNMARALKRLWIMI
ncbi:NT-3 growth factor receptor-like, partial [Carassius auratus]|uniref:NT-3 growth factor receptor-like n=1 Tax=Carassius auratus TaxID=7957 RepID=A0A6P6P7X9_CARAU